MNTTRWPERGRCGACSRPAQRFPSGRWEHDGRPCALRSRGSLAIDDLPVRGLLVFVPEGEALPEPAPKWSTVVTEVDEIGFPIELGIVPPRDQAARWERIRAHLRDEANSGTDA